MRSPTWTTVRPAVRTPVGGPRRAARVRTAARRGNALPVWRRTRPWPRGDDTRPDRVLGEHGRVAEDTARTEPVIRRLIQPRRVVPQVHRAGEHDEDVGRMFG